MKGDATKQAPKESVDQTKVDAAVASALKSMVKHQIGLGEGVTAPTTFVMDANGVWEIKQTAIGCAVKKADKVMGLEAQLAPGFMLTLPKLPWLFLEQAVAWFREVQAKFKTEAYLQVWWDPEKKGYYTVVPEQDVSGGMVHHQGDWDKDGELGHVHVLDLHSHHTMGAFFSGTDDKDEQRYDRLYGVIGEILKPIPAWKWRARSGNVFIDVSLGDVWDVPTGEELPFTVNMGELLKAGTTTVSLNPFQGATFPEEWMKKLITEKKVVAMAPFRGRAWSDGENWEGFQGGSRGYTPLVGKYGEVHRAGIKNCNCYACCSKRRMQFYEAVKTNKDLQERLAAQCTGRTGSVYYPDHGRVVKLDTRTGEVEDIGIASREFSEGVN